MASLSADQRRAIRFRAASVYQRVAAFTTQGPAQADDTSIDAQAAAALGAWNQAFSPGDRDAFAHRLSWDELDGTTVGRSLTLEHPMAVPGWFEPDAEHDWTVWLDLVIEHAGTLAAQLEKGPPQETAYFDEHDEPPFIEIAVPAMRAARDFLLQVRPNAFSQFSDAARIALERQLLKELTVIAERSVYDLFRQLLAAGAEGAVDAAEGSDQKPTDAPPGEDRYRAFVVSMLDGGLPPFFVAYPVLARHIALLMEKWVETTGDLSKRLDADRHAIAERFSGGNDPGNVASIAPALSDPHHGRRRVATLTFDSGLKLVYKPRDVGLEKAVSDFLSWANQHGLEPPQHAVRVLERPGYGWVEFAEQEPFATIDEVRRYYRQAGGLIVIAHLIRATDLHMENVVATRRGPVLVDTESVMQPIRARAKESQPGNVKSDADDPCLATGLVTFGEMGADGERYETGGLRGEGLRGSVRPRRAWKGIRTDALGFGDEHEFYAPSPNRVVLDGNVQSPEDFRDELLEGFSTAYRMFGSIREEVIDAGGPLRAFAGCPARVMFRPTNQYAIVQDVLAVPKYQMSGVARSTALDILARPFALDRARPVAWPLFVEERRALEELDIPHFTVATDDTVVFAGERLIGNRFFTRSGLDVARTRISNLSEQDLAIQCEWLERSLSESATSRFRAEGVRGGAGGEDPLRQHIAVATWIGKEFLERARSDGDALSWPLHAPGQTTTAAEQHYIYGGTLGPALFLAALANISGDRAWADAARRATEPARRFAEGVNPRLWSATEPLGIGNGLGSIVYGLLWIGRLLDDDSYIENARRVALSLDAARVRSDKDLDILSGSAGAILALLALAEEMAGGRFVEIATACGDHLVATQLHTHWGSNWPSRDGRLLAGFAHGAAGTAYALVRLFQATGKRAYLEAALRAHRYERAVYSPIHRNWPLVRAAGHLPGNVSVLMTAWCHGAPGILLARALVRDAVIDEDPDIAGEIEVALNTTTKLAGNAGDHLCCGNVGRCDVLFTAGRQLEKPATVDAAKTIAANVQRNAIRRGRFQLVSSGYEHLVFDPGFFQGLSGIGYELLRLAAPSRLPSILAFEGHAAVEARAAIDERVHS